MLIQSVFTSIEAQQTRPGEDGNSSRSHDSSILFSRDHQAGRKVSGGLALLPQGHSQDLGRGTTKLLISMSNSPISCRKDRKLHHLLTNVLFGAKSSPPTLFPEYTKPGGTKYVYRELDFWTSGFFPGCLYLLLERRRRHTHHLKRLGWSTEDEPHLLHLE